MCVFCNNDGCTRQIISLEAEVEGLKMDKKDMWARIDRRDEDIDKLQEELRRRDMEIAELRATDAWLRKVLYNAENGYCVHGDGIPGIIECKVDKPCFVCEQNAKIEKLEQKIEDFYDKEHDLD